MLIIFDLDDTLIDTSGSITPYKLEMALDGMVHAGLHLENRHDALAMLLRLDKTSESSHTTLSEFCEILGASSEFLNLGEKIVYGDIPHDLNIFPIEGALDLLSYLSQSHRLALVTVGDEAQQHFKLKKAGIDSTIFSKIIVSKERDKKRHYEAIFDELRYLPEETLVCGDRVFIDLAPAKELGCKTVHVKWGRGKNRRGADWTTQSDIDFEVVQLKEIINIIDNL